MNRPAPAFTLRDARPDDADAVATMCAALARHEGSDAPTMSAACFRARGFCARPDFTCLIAEMDGCAIGYAMHVPDYDTDLMCRSAYIADLFVDASARRHGIGRALMAAVARGVAAAGGRTLHWNVLRTNPGARAFYRTIGEEMAGSILCGVEGEAFDRLGAQPVPTGLELRRADRADLPALGAMLYELLGHEGFLPDTLDIPARLAADGFGQDPAFRCHVALRGDRIVGYTLDWPSFDTEPGAPGVYLSDVYVEPAARRGGVARALMRNVARAGAADGARYMEWEVRSENRSARAFYAGFAREYPDVLAMTASGARFAALLRD